MASGVDLVAKGVSASSLAAPCCGGRGAAIRLDLRVAGRQGLGQFGGAFGTERAGAQGIRCTRRSKHAPPARLLHSCSVAPLTLERSLDGRPQQVQAEEDDSMVLIFFLVKVTA